MSNILRIIVNTHKEDDSNDPNITSLREAIVQANQSTSKEKVYIDFVRSNPAPNGYTRWLIQPKSALPAITHHDVYINHSLPANVTIDGSNLSAKAGDSYSLLTVGLYSELVKNSSINRRVHLRHVNLLNNTVTAGNGVKGGGGGLAAGAGISVLHGDVVLENVVFQNLKATGGKGGQSPKGAFASYQILSRSHRGLGVTKPNAPSSGSPGGSGGRPTLLGAEISSIGGSGGSKGTSRRHDTSGANGGNGNNGGFGVGGGGGGGGGGAAMVIGRRYLFSKDPDLYGDGGHGGNGGKGGFGAGGGGGGTGGENAFGKGHSQPGGAGGMGGSIHGNNSGNKGASSNNSNGQQVAGGRYGGIGDALGAALSILNPKSNAELYNVDFINSKADSKATAYNAIYVIDPENRTGTIKSHDTRIAHDTNNNTKPIVENSLINNNDIYGKLLSSSLPATPGNLHYAASYVIEEADAKIRHPEIEHKLGRADVTSLRIEQPRSTMRQINIDSSKLEAEINEIYKEIIPVESEESIKSRFYSNILDGVISAGTGGFASYSSANSLFTASVSTPQDLDAATATQKSSIKMGAGLAVLQLGASIFQANSNFQAELAQNQRNIDKLADKLKVDRSVTADPIDVGQARSMVKIENFTIGEDTIYIDDFWPKSNGDPTYSPIIINGPVVNRDGKTFESFEIHIPNTKTNNNTSTRVALVEVDPESTKKLKAASQATTAAVYVESLLAANKENKRWEIGTILTDSSRNVQSAINYVGGAAGELVIIERPQNVAVDQQWNTTTFDYDDIIYGSNGKEYITTGGGFDQITPGYGEDIVNGGASIDWVNLENLKEPIFATSSQLANQGNPLNSIHITNKNNSMDRKINSDLREVESLTAFGPSSIDLRDLGKPNSIVFPNVSGELEGSYAVRSGSGSIINGSQYNDQFIISLMNDDNESGFDSVISLTSYTNQFNTTQEISTDTNVSTDESLNSDVSSTEVDMQSSTAETDDTNNFQILAQPSIIVGEGGTDKLTFAVPGTAERGLRITEPMSIGEYKNFHAVVEDGIIKALFKDINVQQVDVINESPNNNVTVLGLYDPTLQPTYTLPDVRTTDQAPGSNTDAIMDDQVVINVSVDELVGDNGFSLGESSDVKSTSSSDLEKMIQSFDIQKSTRNQMNVIFQNHLIGNTKNNRFIGTDGDNTMSGKKGDDTLIGGHGNDTIKGGDGDDMLYGGTGKNILYGGNGMDTFRLHEDGYQIIKDFNPLLDFIQVGEGLDRNQLKMRDNGTLVFGTNIVGKIV